MVAGRIGAAADAAYAVTGDTVNTASPAERGAAGEILISDATYQLTHHAFAFAPQRDPAQGQERAGGVRRLLGSLAPPLGPRPRGPRAGRALVGREPELRRMQAAFDDMRAGRAQVLSLIGEPGRGKSRLRRSSSRALEAAGRLAGVRRPARACSALGGRAAGGGRPPARAYGGGARRFRRGIARSKLAAGLETLGVGAEDRAAMVATRPGARARADDARMRHLEPEQLKRQIFMATRALVERRLAAGPLVLVVEDLHWADAASIELLGALAGSARRPSAPAPPDVSADARAGCAGHQPGSPHAIE